MALLFLIKNRVLIIPQICPILYLPPLGGPIKWDLVKKEQCDAIMVVCDNDTIVDRKLQEITCSD